MTTTNGTPRRLLVAWIADEIIPCAICGQPTRGAFGVPGVCTKECMQAERLQRRLAKARRRNAR